MLRHSVIWLLRDTTTPELRAEMLKGLGYLTVECSMVQYGDYGPDIFGGSQPPAESSGETQPRWRGRTTPLTNYDVALHLDFDDWTGHDAYSLDPAHEAASGFNETVSWDDFTARVDWYRDSEPPGRRGQIRHAAMFVWADESTRDDRERVLTSVRDLDAVPGVCAVSVGENVGRLTSDYDWIMEVILPDRATAAQVFAGDAYSRTMQEAASLTKFEWTAQVTNSIRGR
jgi:hypothetical protein